MRLSFAILALALARPTTSRGQSLANIPAGARLRVNGDRATNEGIRRFSVRGTLVAVDSTHVVLQLDPPSTTRDSIPLFGVRHLELFQGQRSRTSMVLTGLGLGALTGTALWWFIHQTASPERGSGQASSPIIDYARNSIPVFIGAGGLVGLTIGQERWLRVSVPQSVFSNSR